MECLGGNGYVEESMLPRLYREAPVNAIWEGSGNVMCLDVLRALAQAGPRDALRALSEEADGLPGAAEAVTAIESALSDADAEGNARAAVERLAMLAAAAALRATAPAVAEMFARMRLAVSGGRMFGTCAIASQEAAATLERSLPA